MGGNKEACRQLHLSFHRSSLLTEANSHQVTLVLICLIFLFCNMLAAAHKDQ